MSVTSESLESQLENCQKLVERRDQLAKLCKNREFKALILEQFMTEDCANYARLSADPALKPENRQDALALAQAAGHLKRWMSVIERMGDQAASQLEDLRQNIDDVRAEEASEGL